MFKKRETLVQNITYMAIMAAINVIFVVTTFFVPYLVFLLVFVLPLTSAIVTLFCKKKYFPIYAIATVGLCLLTTMTNFTDTLFFVVPSIFSGFLFGLMAEKEIPPMWAIISSSLINVGITYAFIPLINALYSTAGNDVITMFARLFGLDKFVYLDYVVPCFILILSLIQCTISYLIIKSQLPKFGFAFVENYVKSPLFGSIFAAILVIIMMFAAPYLSYFFTIILFYFAMFIFVNILEKRDRFCIILLVISTIATILLFAFLYQYVNKPYGLLLLNIYPLFLIIIGLVDYRSINKDDVIK